MTPSTDLRTISSFVDESMLGAAKILSRTRDDLVYPGHPLVPHLPLGIPDTTWIPIVGGSGWVAFVRDRRIRTRSAEVAALREAGLRAVWFGGKKDMGPAEQADLFERHLPRLERELVKRGSGPWGLVLSRAGLAPVRSER
jgi:hypothetical protein